MGLLYQDGRERQEQTRPVPKYLVFGPDEVVMGAAARSGLPQKTG